MKDLDVRINTARRRAAIPISPEFLADALKLPPDMRGVEIGIDHYADCVLLYVESDRLPATAFGVSLPLLQPVYHQHEDGRVTLERIQGMPDAEAAP